MSDDKREDRWTDGPELNPDEAREVRQQREAPPAPPAEDAETLRERQRLVQMEMMDRWIGGVLAEQRRSRRWKLFFRFFFAESFEWCLPAFSVLPAAFAALVRVGSLISSLRVNVSGFEVGIVISRTPL